MTAALVTDSTSYLPSGLAEALDVVVVPLHLVLDGRDLAEPDVEPRAFYARLRETGERPTTSQPSPGAFLQAYDATGADQVLCLTATASMSGTHQSAVLAAGLSGREVVVVDSGTISGGLCLVVGEIARTMAAGTPFADCVALARSLATRVSSTWCSDTHALLTAGGRLCDQVPEGVPVLALDGTGLHVLGSARTTDEAIALQAAAVRESLVDSPSRVSVGHGDVAELADDLAAALLGADGLLGIDRYVVGPVVGAHAGAGNVGASYLRKA